MNAGMSKRPEHARFSETLGPISLGLLLLAFPGCERSMVSAAGPRLAVTTSYLEAAACDLLDDDLVVVRLAEPGTCPGHFDLRPSQVRELRRCRALLRFDFQTALDAKLAGDAANQPAIVQVVLGSGMGLPASYLSACRQVADHLIELDLLSHSQAESRLDHIAARLETISRDATHRVAQAGFTGVPVLASRHQRDFCKWLGLEVVADFRGADTASIAEIEEAIRAGKFARIKQVIANLPEGRRTADALAERLGARVIVFENFPALRDGRVSFDAMFSVNVEALLRSAAP
jgi:zinc transport system substrate-binding protein